MAVSPGGPITFSNVCTTYSPCLPPGLNTNEPVKGARNLANVTENHIITSIVPKNHFHRFTMYTRINLRPQRIRKAGTRNAGKPKFTVMR